MSYGNAMQRAARKYQAQERADGVSLVGTPPSDFHEFCKLCQIKTKDQGIIQFDPDRWFAEQHRFERERTGRDIVLKARQIGFSTQELMRGFCQSSTRTSWNTVVVGHERDLSQDLFENIRFAAEGLAKLGRLPPTSQDNIRQIRFAGMGSQISVTEAGASVDAASKKGHSGTIHRLHATEVSRWNNPVETLTGLLGAVPDGGEILFESTANGAGGWFYDTVMQCRETPGRPYTLHFYPWFDHVRYRTPVVLHFDPEPVDDYEETLREAGCDDEQIQWWRDKVDDLGVDVCLEQFPPNIDLAFRASGRTYFDAPTLDLLSRAVAEPIERRPVVYKPKDGPERILGELLIYKLPHGHDQYVAAGDVSEGLGLDAHTACVMDVKTGETVATFWHDRLEAGDFGLALSVIGRMYNNALVAPERNNNGHAAIRALTAEAKYSSLFHAADGRPGWLTSGQTRPIMFDELFRACRKGHASTPDAGTLGETKTIIVGPDGKPRARDKGSQGGCKDDRVIAWAIAWQVRSVGGSTKPKAGDGQREAIHSGGFIWPLALCSSELFRLLMMHAT